MKKNQEYEFTGNIELEIVPIEDSVDVIFEYIKRYFLNGLDENFVDPQIEVDLAKYIDDLREDLYCIIEYPYVDKVYRDCYYSYFSTKHYSYHRDCIRVSLIENEIGLDDVLNIGKNDELHSRYLGYFVVRPITNKIIGRSMISPKAYIENNFRICKTKVNNLIFGSKISIEGFPHSAQDGESIKCAETTIWAIMEYFGSKYSEYSTVLPTKIRSELAATAFERQLPSDGLTMNQISYALKSFGFGTKVYSNKEYKGREIMNILDCYIESGMPVLTGLESANYGHVIITIGKENEKKVKWRKVKKTLLKLPHKTVSYYDTSDIESRYVVHDDNHAPYRMINLERPGENYDDEESKTYWIESIVVPLYPKIYLDAVIAKQLLLQIFKDSTFGYNIKSDFVFRAFLTSSRSLKEHINNIDEMDSILKYSILTIKMPKFIWCGEIYSRQDFDFNKKAKCLIILDATEANNESIDAFIFAGYPDRCISMCENKYINLNHKFKNYYYFCNLK